MAPSTSPDGAGVRVRIRTGSPLAEVFLIDHAFALVQRSIGDLEATVRPGVYKAKAKLADAEAERLVLCESDEDIDLSDDLHVVTPAPLVSATVAPARDAELAQSLSLSNPPPSPAAAEIMIMTRQRGRRTGTVEAWLVDAAGARVLETGRRGRPAGAVLEIDPGSYYLRWRGAAGVTAEQAVHVVAGWQTQVFVLEEAAGDAPSIGGTRVSVLMSRAGFDPSSEDQKLAEEARTALAEERRVASVALEEAIEGSDNPMLALFGAHLMLLTRDGSQRRQSTARPKAPVRFDADRFARLVGGLRQRLGPDHPDVVALATQLPGPARTDPVPAPPMLWRSWLLLLDASNDTPALIEPATWHRAVAPLPLRPFLIWSTGTEETVKHVEDVLARTLAESESGAPTRRALTERLLVPRGVVDAQADSR